MPSELSSSGASRRARRRVRQALAWCVHLYTATGLIAAALMLLAILRGDGESFRVAFLLMIAATLIDATDGAFARLARVKEVLPGFDGRRLDDLVDFQTYVTLPLLLIWQARLLPPGSEGWLIVPLIAAAYGFCQVNAKTHDGYFLGFPSYWNIVAFYLYVFQPPPGVVVALLVCFAVLTFVPLRYLYATQPGRLNRLTNGLAAVWCVLLVATVWLMPGDPPEGETVGSTVRALAWLSMVFPAYYFATSWFISARRRRRARRKEHAA
jgi:phosphatidylcholine synthase